MPFEATQEKLRELLESATHAIARGEPAAHTVMMAVLGVLKIISQATDTELPEITEHVASIVRSTDQDRLPVVDRILAGLEKVVNEDLKNTLQQARQTVGKGQFAFQVMGKVDKATGEFRVNGGVQIVPPTVVKET